LELEDEIQVLESFGLTLNEARVFLALTLLGTANVKKISKSSNVAREAVYRVLPRLQKLGLVEKEISRPTRFSALTLDDAVTVLLALRNRETRDLQEKAKVLLRINKNFQVSFKNKCWGPFHTKRGGVNLACCYFLVLET
jgi:sugar-specific transcriptional regulator TrmB